jgi:pyruvate carboxylase
MFRMLYSSFVSCVLFSPRQGGGGKGIRRVGSSDQVAAALRQVQGEVPGSPIFVMKLAPVCRHLEVQLIADEWGDAMAIFGRDCSIQRRHQKIIEVRLLSVCVHLMGFPKFMFSVLKTVVYLYFCGRKHKSKYTHAP